MAMQKWDLVAEVARSLVDTEPENAAWWINLAYATRRAESIDKAQAFLLQARKLHPITLSSGSTLHAMHV